MSAPPPMPAIGVPIVYDEQGLVWLPARDAPHEVVGWRLHAGLSCAWAPLPFGYGVVLHMLGGTGGEPDLEDEGFACSLSREGLQRLIADLQSIDAQLEQG